MEETGIPGENHQPVASHWKTLSHNVVSSTPRHEQGLNTWILVVIGTDCTGSYKYNYHKIMTTTVHVISDKYTSYEIQRLWHTVISTSTWEHNIEGINYELRWL